MSQSADDEDSAEDPREYIKNVITRRNYRDKIHLGKTRIDYMAVLAINYREWLYAEIKDLLSVITILNDMVSHSTVLRRLNTIQKRVEQIDRSYHRQIIRPINLLAKGTSGTKTEEEHNEKCREAQDNAWRLIMEVRGYRYELDIMVANALETTLQSLPDEPPQMYR